MDAYLLLPSMNNAEETVVGYRLLITIPKFGTLEYQTVLALFSRKIIVT